MADRVHGTAADSADGFVGVLTELRVHGVSGTPPEDLLRLPGQLIELDSGDQAAGFYRPRFQIASGTDVRQPAPGLRVWQRAVQAYSWGGLTSGPATRALWLLFLPFILVNLAHWTLPPVTRPAASSMAVRLLRILGLAFTLTLMLAAAAVTMDIGGWQCAALDNCVGRLGPASVLGDRAAGARVAWSAVPVLILIVGLWKLGKEDPRRVGIPPDPTDTERVSALEKNTFWQGDKSVARLRACHVAAWASGLGALALTVPARYGIEWSRTAAIVLVILNGLILLTAVVATWFNRATGRGGQGVPGWVSATLMWLRWVSLAAVVGSLFVTGFAPLRSAIPVPSHLPALRPAIYVLVAVQVALLLALFLSTAVAMPHWRSARYPTGFAPALKGFTAPVVATLGWLVGGGFSIGVGLLAAVHLGQPVLSTDSARARFESRQSMLGDVSAPIADRINAFNAKAPLIIAPPYFWAAAANIVVLLAVLLTGLYLWLRVVPRRARAESAVVQSDGAGTDAGRANAVAKARAWASLTDYAAVVIAALTGFTVLLIAVSVALYEYQAFDYVPGLNMTFTNVGVITTAGLAGAFIAVAIRAIQDRQLRRTVAVLWDVVTFWPRANHPLTPPCYGERAVPELLVHTRSLISDGPRSQRVVIAAHSQGGIIAAAALLLADLQTCRRVGLLTFGSPLRRLYARIFPAYFGHKQLSVLRAAIDRRWINLWAFSDPIGAFVFDDENRSVGAAPENVDCRLPDTTTLDANPDGTYPPVCGHSGFWLRPEYEAALEVLEGQLLPAGAPIEGPRAAAPDERAL